MHVTLAEKAHVCGRNNVRKINVMSPDLSMDTDAAHAVETDLGWSPAVHGLRHAGTTNTLYPLQRSRLFAMPLTFGLHVDAACTVPLFWKKNAV